MPATFREFDANEALVILKRLHWTISAASAVILPTATIFWGSAAAIAPAAATVAVHSISFRQIVRVHGEGVQGVIHHLTVGAVEHRLEPVNGELLVCGVKWVLQRTTALV